MNEITLDRITSNVAGRETGMNEITPDRITFSEALADILLRFSSRKFLAAMLGVAVLFYAMVAGYLDADTAIKSILGILAAYGAIEGGPDIVERLRRDE